MSVSWLGAPVPSLFHHSIPHLTCQPFLLDCPPDSLSSPSSLSLQGSLPLHHSRSSPPPALADAPSQLPPSVLSAVPPPPHLPRGCLPGLLSLSPGCPWVSWLLPGAWIPSGPLPGGWEGSSFCLLWVFLRNSPLISRQGRLLGR